MIYGFMHIYQINNWEEIVEEQLQRIFDSGLYDKLDRLYIGFNGKEKIRDYEGKISILYHMDKPKMYDLFILSFIQMLCFTFEGQVFSIHAKGITHVDKPQFSDWRKLLEYFTLDRHEVCLKELEKNDVAGSNWHLGEGYMGAHSKRADGHTVTPHFSASFWWANASYIRRLPLINLEYNRYESEFWIGKAEPLVAELWHTGIKHQKKFYSEKEYVGKLNLRYFKGKELL